MKHTTHRCDFCGTAQKENELGTLTVPMSAEDVALKDRCDGKASTDDQPYGFASLLLSWPSTVSSAKTKSYDICRECAEGLVRARAASIRKLHEAMEA